MLNLEVLNSNILFVTEYPVTVFEYTKRLDEFSAAKITQGDNSLPASVIYDETSESGNAFNKSDKELISFVQEKSKFCLKVAHKKMPPKNSLKTTLPRNFQRFISG